MPQHKPPRCPGPAAAFSLLELLVVVGIIAILAAILLPALGGAHEQGRRAHCLANLTQIGKALGIYSNDFSEYLPSHAGWGLSDYTYSVDGGTLTPYFGQQGPSRHMVIGYGGIDANPSVDLALGNINFEPVGLGILAMRNNLTGASLICRSLQDSLNTFYGSGVYQYSTIALNDIGGNAAYRPLVASDGRSFYHTDLGGGNTVTAVLSSYSYRDTPFYSRLKPSNAPIGWTYNSDYPDLYEPVSGWLAQWTLNFTRPALQAQFMCPPFKTMRALGGRSIASDTFDYAPAGGGAFTAGLGSRDHKTGYNILYGDGHAAWFDDDSKTLSTWDNWADLFNPGSDNLTISSASSQPVWNQFDRAMGIDCP